MRIIKGLVGDCAQTRHPDAQRRTPPILIPYPRYIYHASVLLEVMNAM